MAKKVQSKTPLAKATVGMETPLIDAAKVYTSESRHEKKLAILWCLATLYCFLFAFIYNFSVLTGDFAFSALIGIIERSQDNNNIEILKFMPINLLALTAIGLCSKFVSFHVRTAKERKTASLELLALNSAQQQLSEKEKDKIIMGYFSSHENKA